MAALLTHPMLLVALSLLALYLVFLWWYGGKGAPLSAAEIEGFKRALAPHPNDPASQQILAELEALVANDDGREFVMQNLVRYRPKALYPPGHQYSDDPREADRRYGRSIVWPLLRYGNLPIWIARRAGNFIEPDGADAWHYVAMVRYRSRRDFLRFALASEKKNNFIHKWAAIEKTHVFPVQPLISLVFVRAMVGMALALLGVAVGGWLR
jgi:hypothetical protein